MAESIRLIAEHGSGKTIVSVYEKNHSSGQFAETIARSLPESFRSILLEVDSFHERNWQERARELEDYITSMGVRFACFVSYGSVGSLTQHLYLALPRAVRSMVMIDPTTRPHPSRWTRIVSSIEEHLPVGLPFRSADSVFNSRPFLQRFRCPILILTTAHATGYQQAEARILLDTLPTAWHETVQNTAITSRIPELLIDFQAVAVKSPQRKREPIAEATHPISKSF